MSRLRAYQLGTTGGKFSLFNKENKHFTLIEARLTEMSEKKLDEEMRICGVTTINLLHITSWDKDHCNKEELENILKKYSPKRIEYPHYLPDSDNGKDSLKLIKKYNVEKMTDCQPISDDYIKSLKITQEKEKVNVIYNIPCFKLEKSNDNSVVKLFRNGKFNVMSLGDIESGKVRDYLMTCSIFKNEIEVLILPHHGADNGFITDEFLKTTKPIIAICSSNYGNQYDHPDKVIRSMLYENGIPVVTTKTGDITIEYIGGNKIKVINFNANGEGISSIKDIQLKNN